jgi:Leishmanolysin
VGVTRPEAETTGTATYGGQTYTQLILPGLVDYAKTFYGCTTLTGVPLEDDGGSGSAGSHWEKEYFPDEFMNPVIENPDTISYFSFLFLKETGWYTLVGATG